MASMTSSQGIWFTSPDRAISAQTSALEAPITLRLTQGTSTSPATGSHTRPRMLDSAMAQAWAICTAVPPMRWVMAAAAMPEAEPTSAWHPPSAPEMEARAAMTCPKPAET